MSKRYKFFLILGIVAASIFSIICFGRAIYVIANGLAQFESTTDAFPYNPIILFFLALIAVIWLCASISHYKTEKEFYKRWAILKEKITILQSDDSDMNDMSNKHNADSKNDTKASSEHYHNL